MTGGGRPSLHRRSNPKSAHNSEAGTFGLCRLSAEGIESDFVGAKRKCFQSFASGVHPLEILNIKLEHTTLKVKIWHNKRALSAL
jgi:hypothetical protein